MFLNIILGLWRVAATIVSKSYLNFGPRWGVSQMRCVNFSIKYYVSHSLQYEGLGLSVISLFNWFKMRIDRKFPPFTWSIMEEENKRFNALLAIEKNWPTGRFFTVDTDLLEQTCPTFELNFETVITFRIFSNVKTLFKLSSKRFEKESLKIKTKMIKIPEVKILPRKPKKFIFSQKRPMVLQISDLDRWNQRFCEKFGLFC